MNMIDKFRGCFIGLALGDALCAPYEGGVLERLLWRYFGKTRKQQIKFTDDTQMSIDIAQSLILHKSINQDALAEEFANSYQWSRGYGPGAAKILKKMKQGIDWRILNKSQFKNGSFGNGAAMRVAPVALYYNADEKQLIQEVEKSAVITHVHELAITGALNIALAISLSLKDHSKDSIVKSLIVNNKSIYLDKLLIAQQWLLSNKNIPPIEVATQLGNGIQAINSTITAIYIALAHLELSYKEMIGFIQKCGGDTDTIAAMAGAIWGASNGINAIKHPKFTALESRQKIISLAEELFYLHKKVASENN